MDWQTIIPFPNSNSNKCILHKTQLSIKILFQVKMSRRKEVEKGKQHLESLQRIRNLDDKRQ